MFGKKARIAALEKENAQLRANYINETNHNRTEEASLRNQLEYLVRTIRDMDDQIFRMSQCGDWNSMRPMFNKLQDGMTHRKVAESNRINDVLRTELISTYKPPIKQIGSK